MKIRFITPEDLDHVFPIMSELRPLLTYERFKAGIPSLCDRGYLLVGVFEEAVCHALAGFRISENLGWRRFLYVDELVTTEKSRSKGYGKVLFDWLRSHAAGNGCKELHLDSGVQRFAAHRFYLREGMEISSHHFRLVLEVAWCGDN